MNQKNSKSTALLQYVLLIRSWIIKIIRWRQLIEALWTGALWVLASLTWHTFWLKEDLNMIKTRLTQLMNMLKHGVTTLLKDRKSVV